MVSVHRTSHTIPFGRPIRRRRSREMYRPMFQAKCRVPKTDTVGRLYSPQDVAVDEIMEGGLLLVGRGSCSFLGVSLRIFCYTNSFLRAITLSSNYHKSVPFIIIPTIGPCHLYIFIRICFAHAVWIHSLRNVNRKGVRRVFQGIFWVFTSGAIFLHVFSERLAYYEYCGHSWCQQPVYAA